MNPRVVPLEAGGAEVVERAGFGVDDEVDLAGLGVGGAFADGGLGGPVAAGVEVGEQQVEPVGDVGFAERRVSLADRLAFLPDAGEQQREAFGIGLFQAGQEDAAEGQAGAFVDVEDDGVAGDRVADARTGEALVLEQAAEHEGGILGEGVARRFGAGEAEAVAEQGEGLAFGDRAQSPDLDLGRGA